MGLEVATYVSDLVSTNPLSSDLASTSDDHHRLIKSVLQATFPGAGDALIGVVSSVAGTDTITATMTGLTAYTTGLTVIIKPANNSTGAATINIGSLGAKSIVKGDGTALESGDLQASVEHVMVYDGTNFVLLNPMSFSLVNGTLSGTLGVTGLTTLAALTATGALTLNGALTTDNTTADEVGFKGIPFNNQNGNYTLVLTDAGKTIYKTSGAGNTITIPANSSVAFPVGTVITFINVVGSGSVSIAITTDAMALAGAGSLGTRTLDGNFGIATAIKINATSWIISGTGLS
jgi:hypothetical protein